MEQTVQKQRVAVYCRVATDSEDHSASLAVQEAYYTEMVGQNPEWELAGIYADRGIAGADRQNQKVVTMSSPDSMRVSMPSISKITLTPLAFSIRTVSRQSAVLLAKREIDLTRMMLILSCLQAVSILLCSF